MRIHRHRRQILLFLIAILLPAAILTGLAARMMYQERELAAKRLTDQRHAAADQVRRELSARLEAIRLQEINRLIRSPISDQAKESADSAVVFTAKIEGDRPVLPWAAPPPAESAEFAKHRQDGEAQEFVKKDVASAAAALLNDEPQEAPVTFGIRKRLAGQNAIQLLPYVPGRHGSIMS